MWKNNTFPKLDNFDFKMILRNISAPLPHNAV